MNELEEAEAKGEVKQRSFCGEIERQFGPPAMEAHRPRIERADAEALLTWSHRILTAERVEDIFG